MLRMTLGSWWGTGLGITLMESLLLHGAAAWRSWESTTPPTERPCLTDSVGSSLESLQRVSISRITEHVMQCEGTLCVYGDRLSSSREKLYFWHRGVTRDSSMCCLCAGHKVPSVHANLINSHDEGLPIYQALFISSHCSVTEHFTHCT